MPDMWSRSIRMPYLADKESIFFARVIRLIDQHSICRAAEQCILAPQWLSQWRIWCHSGTVVINGLDYVSFLDQHQSLDEPIYDTISLYVYRICVITDNVFVTWLPFCRRQFSWMKMHELRLKFHISLFPRIQLKYPIIDSDNGLAPTRRQTIIWTNNG